MAPKAPTAPTGKRERALQVNIPRPDQDRPAWSRVGIIGIAGFALGVIWPRLAGVKVGPSVPGDIHAQIEASATPAGSAAPKHAPAASVPSAAAVVPVDVAPAVAANQELVVIGAGKVVKCADGKKDKKVDDCGKLDLDAITVKKLADLPKCPSAIGLDGKMTLGLEVNFDKNDVQVAKSKKGTSLPSTTVNGILQCAARELGKIGLDEVAHNHVHYTLAYALTFYPPGKHPENVQEATPDGEATAGNEAEAGGTATVSVDSAPLRKEPKGNEKVGRLVRGTKVKILTRQNDWYKVEAGSKVGWVYRGAIGL